MAKEKKSFKRKKKIIVKENPSLKKELEDLKPIIDKFTFSSKLLQIILNN